MITDASLSSTVAVIVLAAGTSSRMGASGFHKLLAEFEGVPLIRRSTLVALGCQSQTVVVVTGHRNAEIREAVADLEVQIAYNDQYTSGMASSLGLGVTIAERSQPDGILVMLADMPSLTSSDLDTLIAAFQRNRRKFIVRAVAQGAPGNPVIFPQCFYGQLKSLAGDKGARGILDQSGLPVIDIEIGNSARIDVDTPEEVVAAGGILRCQSGRQDQ